MNVLNTKAYVYKGHALIHKVIILVIVPRVGKARTVRMISTNVASVISAITESVQIQEEAIIVAVHRDGRDKIVTMM